MPQVKIINNKGYQITDSGKIYDLGAITQADIDKIKAGNPFITPDRRTLISALPSGNAFTLDDVRSGKWTLGGTGAGAGAGTGSSTVSQGTAAGAGAGVAGTGTPPGGGGALLFPDDPDLQEYFNNLPQAEQTFFSMLFNLMRSQNSIDDQVWKDAVKTAKAEANPIFAEVLRIASDEMNRAIGSQHAGFAYTQEELNQRIQELQEDLASGLNYLSAEETAALNAQLQNFQIQQETLTGQIEASGLTFSSKRTTAESQLAATDEAITTGIKRRTAKAEQDLKTGVLRGTGDIERRLAEEQRLLNERITTLSRGFEQQFGSTATEALEGEQGLMGGITGTESDRKQQDIINRALLLAAIGSPISI